jgi:hypothetical protein
VLGSGSSSPRWSGRLGDIGDEHDTTSAQRASWRGTHRRHEAAEGYIRRFCGRSGLIERPDPNTGVAVLLIGTQFADGSVERMLRVTGLDDPDVLTLGEARQLARTLFNLCEENH